MWLDAAGVWGVALVAVCVGLFWGLIGAFLGSYKNRRTRGLFLCMVLGPLGLLPLLFSSDGTRDEGLGDMLMAITLAAVIQVMVAWFFWNGYFKPALKNIEVAAQQQVDEQKREEMRREKAERNREQALRLAEYHGEQEAPAADPAPTPVVQPQQMTGVFANYPPGVDTPEKRREFLQAQIEAKKNGTAPVPRTSNRTRGY